MVESSLLNRRMIDCRDTDTKHSQSGSKVPLGMSTERRSPILMERARNVTSGRRNMKVGVGGGAVYLRRARVPWCCRPAAPTRTLHKTYTHHAAIRPAFDREAWDTSLLLIRPHRPCQDLPLDTQKACRMLSICTDQLNSSVWHTYGTHTVGQGHVRVAFTPAQAFKGEAVAPRQDDNTAYRAIPPRVARRATYSSKRHWRD
jgi:hypothetical protein